jgi:protein-S-isoprenylcysteine O-methyltransferase Ste14
MTTKIILSIIYFAGIFFETGIRAPHRKRNKANQVRERRVDRTERGLLSALFVAMFFVPLIYALTPWLDFANYELPAWATAMGLALFTVALVIFWRAQTDLGREWSPSLEIREGHQLIAQGIYGLLRHPMYASQWLWSLAQPLLLHNWIAGFAGLLAFIPLYFLRLPKEERMMEDAFGAEYRAYRDRVGGVIPRLGR